MNCSPDQHCPILDASGGCEVCTVCGLVLNELVAVEDRNLEKLVPGKSNELHHERILRQFLLDSLSLIHRDCMSIIDAVLSELHMYAWEHNDSSILTLNPAKIPDRAKLALFTWCALQAGKTNHSPLSGLLHAFDISREHFIRAEKKLNWTPPFVSPSDMVEVVCTKLNTTYPFMVMLKPCVRQMDHVVRRPEIVVGGVLCALASHAHMQGTHYAGPSIVTIADAVGCSWQTLQDMKCRITNECRTEIQKQWRDFPYKSNFLM